MMTQPSVGSDDPVEVRDRGLRRVRIATGWTVATSAVFSVVLAAGYAGAAPAPTSAPTSQPGPNVPGAGPTSATGGSTPTSAPSTPAQPAPATTVLQAPTQPPAPVQSPPHVVSGSS